MIFRFIGFSKNLIERVIEENYREKAVYLFPNRQSAKEAKKIFLKTWRLNPHEFMTMDQWVETFCLSELPILKEEKRTLAFYLSLSRSHKQLLGINSYFQSIKLAQNFFRFWEEINNEAIEISSIRKLLQASSVQWQKDLFEIYLNLKESYKAWINDHSFTDSIYLFPEVNDKQFYRYNKIIVANQFYFSNREKQILKYFSDKVTVYYQIPEKFVNKDELTIQDTFTAGDIDDFNNREVAIFEADGQMDMIAHLLRQKMDQQITVDFRSNEQPYNYFINEHIIEGRIDSFQQSSTYTLIEFIYNILKKSVSLEKEDKDLIIWDLLLKLINYKPFQSIMRSELNIDWEKFISDYHKLQDRNYLYLDLNGSFLKFVNWTTDSVKAIKAILQLVEQFSGIRNFTELKKIMLSGIPLLILNHDQDLNSEFLDEFLRAVSDFDSIENSSLNMKWRDLMLEGSNKFTISITILKLFLDYLKPKSILIKEQKKHITLTSLHDLRNLQLEDLTILNAVEGFLPPPPVKPVLLTEIQRKELGLKTYENIKLREKYYFLRTIATSRTVNIYTYNNINADIEKSSFLEELILFSKFKIHYQKISANLKIEKFLQQQFRHSESIYISDHTKAAGNHFFSIPFDKDTDLIEGSLPLTGYSSTELIGNPVSYYLKFLKKLKPKERNLKLDFSEKLIGQIAHEILQKIWQRLLEVYEGNRIHHNFLHTNENYCERALDNIISRPDFTYMKPHNYSEKYFHNIFLPILKDGVKNFFYKLHNELDLTDRSIEVFPEFKETTSISSDKLGKIDFNLALSGRSDLIIRWNEKTMIFDYKTGKYNNQKYKKNFNQLNFYKFMLDYLQKGDSTELISNFLYYIEEKKLIPEKTKSKDSKTPMETFRDDLFEAVSKLAESGFAPSESRDSSDIAEISRWDLFDRRGKDG